MSYENPTPLHVGMTGTLEGRRLRVASRVVLGMEQDGETYYWNEFTLVDGFGRSVTLVFEETENGPEWKLFKPFEPLRPLSASDAAAKRVGDTIELDGVRRRVSLVDQSRVYHIEGTAPEGIAVGDVANYFNIDTDVGMLVVSWTGDDVEYYEGRRLDPSTVASGFGVSLGRTALVQPSQFSGGFNSKTFGALAVAVSVIVGLGFALLNQGGCGGRSSPPAPAAKRVAPSLRLAKNAEGKLGGQTFRITGEALVEINRLGARLDRREYQLFSDTEQFALLVQGLTGAAHEWHLLLAVPPPAAVSPYDAAARRSGTTIDWAGSPMRVTELFQSKRLQLDASEMNLWPALQYGFVARGANDWLLTRWTESQVDFYRGQPVSEKDVLAAFQSRAQSNESR